MKIVNVPQMVAMEKATDAAGFTYDQMMAEAGGALAETIVEHVPSSDRILFLIGPGNNGGDGLVACARLQEAGHHVIPYIWKRKSGSGPMVEADPLVGAVSDIVWADDDSDYLLLQSWVPQSAVIVDALLGTGNVRAIGGTLATLLETVRAALDQQASIQPTRIDPTQPVAACSPLVIACDCPSGLHCDTGEIDPLSLSVDLTVTFALPKRGHFLQPGAAACGRLVIADINIDRDLAPDDAPDVITPDEIAAMLPVRPTSAHKGTFGKSLIVAGSANYPGAAAIACTAAYRAGAGLAHLAAPASVCQVVASQVPEPVHTVLPSDLGAITQAAVSVLSPLLPNYQGMLIGPGLGTDAKTVEFVETLLVGRTQIAHPIGFLSQRAVEPEGRPDLPPLIVDADGLNALAQLDGGPADLPANSILTPHPGEMARLTGLTTSEINAKRWDIAARFASEWGQIVVLKGAYTVIAHPAGALAISPFADAALATAGSGDALAGAIVALLAQGLSTWDAARAGVYLHGLAGRLAATQHGPALLASDIAQELSHALAMLS